MLPIYQFWATLGEGNCQLPTNPITTLHSQACSCKYEKRTMTRQMVKKSMASRAASDRHVARQRCRSGLLYESSSSSRSAEERDTCYENNQKYLAEPFWLNCPC